MVEPPKWPPVVCLLVFYICVASPTFYRGSLVPPGAYGGRDAVSCLRLGHEGLWLLSWAFSFSLPSTDAQVTGSGRSKLPCSQVVPEALLCALPKDAGQIRQAWELRLLYLEIAFAPPTSQGYESHIKYLKTLYDY